VKIDINIEGNTVATVNVNGPCTADDVRAVTHEISDVFDAALELIPPSEARQGIAQRARDALTSFVKLFGITDAHLAASNAEDDAEEGVVPCSNS
jgi:hypothetical protein